MDNVIGAYPSMVNLKDGSVLIVYYEEGAGSSIRAKRFRASRQGCRVDSCFKQRASTMRVRLVRVGVLALCRGATVESGRAAELPEQIESQPCATAPDIDGVIGDDEWQSAPPIEFEMKMVQLNSHDDDDAAVSAARDELGQRPLPCAARARHNGEQQPEPGEHGRRDAGVLPGARTSQRR